LRTSRLAALPDAVAALLEKLDLRWNPLPALPAVAAQLERRGCFVLW